MKVKGIRTQLFPSPATPKGGTKKPKASIITTRKKDELMDKETHEQNKDMH